jgi:hypothetical protein
MMAGNWRESRVALVAAALALLTGTPAVLAAAGIGNMWMPGGAAVVAAVVVVSTRVRHRVSKAEAIKTVRLAAYTSSKVASYACRISVRLGG